MRLSPWAIGPALAGCVLIAVTSCNNDEPQTEAGFGPSISPAVAAVSAYDIVKVPSMAIDGNLTEWADIAAISMADNSGRAAGLDNTAKVKLAWDDTYLYASYNVTDTELLAVQTTRDHADIYKDDDAELYIDPQGDAVAATTKMTATDYHFLANIRNALGDNKGTTPPSGQDASYNAASFLAKAMTNGTLNATGTDVGYTIEIRVSWADLGVAPAVGKFMRIDPAVGDRDGSAATTEEFDWAGLSSFNNPSGWKDVKLVAAPPQATAIPFGLWGLLPDTMPSGTIWTGGVLSDKSPDGVLARLQAARTKSPRIGMWFKMAGGSQSGYMNANGSFNVQNWKDSLDRGHGGTIQPNGTSSYYPQYLPYIQDGTFQGIVLLDDLGAFTPYPTFAEIEAIAAHAKLRFPALPTAVRERATFLETQHGGAVYTKLDAAWAQYRSDRGSSASYRDLNIAAAKRLKLGLVLGINITDGIRPAGTYVPPDSLLIWGTEFLKAGASFSDYVCGFYMWSAADYPYLTHANMTTLANKAKAHVAAPCKRR